MAQSTASYAAGDMGKGHWSLGEESRSIKGKKRRTVFSQMARPLFAAEAEFRASKVFTRSKKGMLALYGTDLHVVDVLGLEAADVASGLADVTSHVLRWVNIADLLDISFAGPATLRIEHGDTTDKIKVRGIGDHSTAAQDDDLPSAQSMGGASVAMSVATSTTVSPSSASIRVTYDSFSLTFRDAGVAQRAAAAIMFQQAQYAAVRHWLRAGLHAGFRCDLISVKALPLLYDDSQHPTHTTGPGGLSSSKSGLPRSHSILPPHVLYSCASGSFGRASFSGGSGAGKGPGTAGVVSTAAAAYAWGDADVQDWGCSVPLPAGWGNVLNAVAGSRSAQHGEDGPGITPEELTCPVVLEHGPKAIQVTVSTPLGAAVATITPQLAKAALQYSTCRDILALPLHPCSSSSSAAPMAAFTWSVQGNVATSAGAAAGVEGSTGSSGNVSNAGLSADADEGSISSAGASGTSSGLPLMHTLDTFAALTVQVMRTPATATMRGVGKVFDPEAPARSPRTASSAAGMWAPAAAQHQAAAVQESSSTGSSWQQNSSLQVQLAVCATLAALAVQQSSGSTWALLLQLLLLAAVAGAAVMASRGSGTSSRAGSRTHASSSAGQQAASGVQQSGNSSSDSSEDVRCCGWSIMLVTADLCSAPSRHLQMQVSLAKASRGMARLRLRVASMSTGGAAMPLLAAPSDDDDDTSMPVLVSEPEPIWLNTDTKQRFINAKPTLEASQDQARRTNKWRQQMDVDTVLMRPCPKFPLMCRLLPTYLLSDDSPEGHAVVLMKVGGVKDLCDAIFQTPPDSPEGLSLQEAEHTLALLNEYLVQVAAPKPIPAGFQVQIYDLTGFKLSYVMGDMFTLFKLLVRFGLYYPERLRLALVINAPAWFSTPWKAMSAFLDENTSAKVVVVGKPQAALSTLAHHLGGIDNVPVAWGGKCNLPFEEYPSNVRMMQFGMALNAGQKPFPGLRAR